MFLWLKLYHFLNFVKELSYAFSLFVIDFSELLNFNKNIVRLEKLCPCCFKSSFIDYLYLMEWGVNPLD